MNEIVKQIKEVIIQENEKLRHEFKQDNKSLRQELRQEFKQANETLRQEFKQDNEALRQAFIDQFFVFETEFGRKIDIMYDYIMLQKEIFDEKFENIRNLDRRMEICEIQNLNHEKRISILEKNQS